MSNHSFFDHLFEYSRQVSPYLDGQMGSELCPDEQWIVPEEPCADHIQGLYHSLSVQHPEAGSAYWLTRTWTLLCWQPIYVAFISIYACRGLPKLSTIRQRIHPQFISGFRFADDTHHHDEIERLVEQAGKELCQLFHYYRQEMSRWTRIRPGFTNHLLADGILACMVRLSQFTPELSEDYLRNQAQLWLKACGLPEKLVNTLSYCQRTQSLKLVRKSCCLVYKCHDGKLCSDCPRHPDNK